MQTPVDEQLRAEVENFRLRFTCEECAHFDGERRCGHGYPCEPHRGVDLSTRVTLEFCKEFELV